MAKVSLTDDPELVRRSYGIIDESILFHKCLADKTADAVVWENVVFKKSGGIKILEAMLALETNAERKREIRTNKRYWERNYHSIRQKVYK